MEGAAADTATGPDGSVHTRHRSPWDAYQSLPRALPDSGTDGEIPAGLLVWAHPRVLHFLLNGSPRAQRPGPSYLREDGDLQQRFGGWILKHVLVQRADRLRQRDDPGRGEFPYQELLIFLAFQQVPEAVRRPLWGTFARSPLWQDRLSVAVSIGPRPNGEPPRPRHLALLRLLAEDGNRLVRAAARGRLRGETFSW